ncbi:hypothetical protein [uncultured Campylobacter sp.]|uniref:hypothetical protein n=1 Tax=uncultured Campylobacter sp. TaxID=218934 RepID=UPI003211A831
MIVFLLNLRANLAALLYFCAVKCKYLSAEILQILGLNLARKFNVGLPSLHKFNTDIVI